MKRLYRTLIIFLYIAAGSLVVAILLRVLACLPMWLQYFLPVAAILACAYWLAADIDAPDPDNEDYEH